MLKRSRRYWWAFLLLAAVLCVVWWKVTRPPEMQLVARFPSLTYETIGFDDTGHWAYYRVDRAKDDRSPDYLTLYDWGNHPLWRMPLHLPADRPILSYGESFTEDDIKSGSVGKSHPWDIKISPDGHMMALLLEEPAGLRVQRWHDVKLLTEQTIKWSSRCQQDAYILNSIDNSGSVWLTDLYPGSTIIYLDGVHVATGIYHMSPQFANEEVECILSPDHMALVGYSALHGLMAYATVKLCDNNILMTNRYTARQNYGIEGWKGAWCVDTSGICYGPNGAQYANNHWNFLNFSQGTSGGIIEYDYEKRVRVTLSPKKRWELPPTSALTGACSADGHSVAIITTLKPLHHNQIFKYLPHLNDYIADRENWYLAVYSYPGCLRAILMLGNSKEHRFSSLHPGPWGEMEPQIQWDHGYSVSKFGCPYDIDLAADEHHVLFRAMNAKGKQEWFIYRW